MKNLFPVRVGANAIVESENRLLVVEFDDETGPHYNLPGGGVQPGERIPDALTREVREETTADVEVGDLVFVHEYHPPDYGGEFGSTHKLTLFFECDLSRASAPSLPENPDPNQVGVEWLSLDSIGERPLLPDLGGAWQAIARSNPRHRYTAD